MSARIGGCPECGALPDRVPTVYENITMDDVISQFHRERPTTYWEVGRDLLPQLLKLKDDASRYIMSSRSDEYATLFGISYRIVDGRGLRLVTEVRS